MKNERKSERERAFEIQQGTLFIKKTTYDGYGGVPDTLEMAQVNAVQFSSLFFSFYMSPCSIDPSLSHLNL